MMNFKEFFEQKKRADALYKVDASSCIDFYCGFDEKNNYCLALRGNKPFPMIDSTKLLLIEQKVDSIPDTYWLYISLKDCDAKNVFFSFCLDIYESVKEQNNFDDLYVLIKNRMDCWKKMFSKVHKQLSKEMIKGLYGELLFINSQLEPQIGIEEAIKSWSGPLGTSKDFAYKDNWYEIKTTSAGSPVVKISSINQLSDSKDGFLVVYRLEETSEMYSSNSSDVITLYESICEKLRLLNDKEVSESFFEKLNKIGFAPDEEYRLLKYRNTEPLIYLVNNDFPCIKEKDIKHQEIAKVSYELILNTLEKFRSDIWKQ